MNTEMKTFGQCIDLGDNIKLVYQEPEEFCKYHVVYYGYKYADYYFRNSPTMLLEKAKYIDSGYLILQDNKIVGGAFIKPNFMADLFVIPPFNDYCYLADKLLKYLKIISNKSEKIFLQEIIEDYVPFYESKNCEITESGFWMIRPTEKMKPIVPEMYETKDIADEYKYEIAEVIIAAYKANPAVKFVDSKQHYAEHVERAIQYIKNNSALHDSSKVMFYKPTNEIVGSCLHMEFEGVPLIMSFAVRPDHQGKGVGSYLLKNSISCSSTKYSTTRLYVFKCNPAIDIYEHMGFIKNKTLNDMYLR
jgi:ribosomal protein S18 acetylase RimI-like enzyme